MTLNELREYVERGPAFIKRSLHERGDELPSGITTEPLSQEEASKSDRDRSQHFALGFFKDKSWLLAGLSDGQPLTYAALMNGSDLHLLLEQNELTRSVNMRWFLEVSNFAYEIRLQNYWETEEELEKPLAAHRDYLMHEHQLGHDIAISYQTLCQGLNDIYSYEHGDVTGALPIKWEPVSNVMLVAKGVDNPLSVSPREGSRLLSKELSYLEGCFPYMNAAKCSDPFPIKSLRVLCAIDNAEGENGKSYIVFQAPYDRSVVLGACGLPAMYLVEDGNWMDFKSISEPAKYLDSYVASKLSAGKLEECRFEIR